MESESALHRGTVFASSLIRFIQYLIHIHETGTDRVKSSGRSVGKPSARSV